jgi:2,3-bisphosphoglycerate-independent phosphoglycerate mutase
MQNIKKCDSLCHKYDLYYLNIKAVDSMDERLKIANNAAY